MGKTTYFEFHKPELTDPANIRCFDENWDKIDQEFYKSSKVVTAYSTDGVAYTATVEGLTSLYVGLELTIIPNMMSASRTPTLNVNGLGAISIRLPLNSANSTATTIPTPVDGGNSVEVLEKWLSANKPVKVMYDGSYWKTTTMHQQSAQALYGVVPPSSGGTGENSLDEAISAFKVPFRSEPTLVGANLARSGYYYIEFEGTDSDLTGTRMSGGVVYFRYGKETVFPCSPNVYGKISKTGAITVHTSTGATNTSYGNTYVYALPFIS